MKNMFPIQNEIAVIALSNPPVNSLGHVLREHIVRMLELAQANDAVRGLSLIHI